MSPEEIHISTIQGDYDRTMRPALMESYSFEYAYRLFLVLCSSKRNLISSLSSKELDVLEPDFHNGMKECIAALNEDKGLGISDTLQEQYASFATTNLLRYLKGGMRPNPVSLATQVAKALENKLYQDGVLDPDIEAISVFLEKKA